MAQKRSQITQPPTRSRLATSTTSSWRDAVAKCLQARPVGTNNTPRERWEARGVRHLAEPKVDDMSRQQTALAVKLSALMNKETISSDIISAASLVNYVNRVLNLGLDVHYRQVTVAMQEDGGRIKAAGKMRHVDFLNWVQKKLQEGWQIYSCYEAGASGYWLHRELVKLGVKNLVVVPKAMGQGARSKRPISAMPGSCAIAWI